MSGSRSLQTVLRDYLHLKFSRDWEISKEMSLKLGQCVALIDGISSAPIPPHLHEKLKSVSLIKGSQATTAIEGNSLSFEEIERIQKGERLPPSKEYQEREVNNILLAFSSIDREICIEGRAELISPDLILRFHFMIGRDLGKSFEALPGKFRTNNVIISSYRPPDHRYVPDLIKELCDWMRGEFQFEGGRQRIDQALIQAITAHVYISWIHPFSDGNGRTARLLEFYLLSRAGCPDIATHILSNYYNSTRNEYYRQFDLARKQGSLSGFIDYAVNGFLDGLKEVLADIKENQWNISWENYIYEAFHHDRSTKHVSKRRRKLALSLPFNRSLNIREMLSDHPIISVLYGETGPKTLKRDLNELLKMKLVRMLKENSYIANREILRAFVPQKFDDPGN